MANRKHSEETKLKMSLAAKGRHVSEETRQKIREKLKGRVLPPNATQRQKGRYVSDETRLKHRAFRHTEDAKSRIGQSLRASESYQTAIRSAERSRKISESRLGHEVSLETRQKISEKNRLNAAHNFRGGQSADDFAAVLCPVGFVREHHVLWGHGNERFILDFAHVDGKINIELDGASHVETKEYDVARDELLKLMGWRVIRIRL